MRSFELKFAWSDHQLHVFQQEVGAWRAGGGYGVRFDPQPNSPEHIMRLHVGETPPGVPLIIGDVLHALRSGLDHLAFDLACSYTNPLPADMAATSEFPIFGDRAMTKGERERKIGAMNPAAAAIIERLQPSARGNDYAKDPLWHLYELARVDRHRLLHVTAAQLQGVGVGGNNLHVVSMIIKSVGPHLKSGAELGRCVVRPINPGAPMQMNVTTDPQIVFEDGIRASEPVLDVLQQIGDYIKGRVVPPLRQYLK